MTKSSKMKSFDPAEKLLSELDTHYREICKRAIFFNDEYSQKGKCKLLCEIASVELYRHTIVRAFAISTGGVFKACVGRLIQSRMNTARKDEVARNPWGNRATLKLSYPGSLPMEVLTRNPEHSWLEFSGCVVDLFLPTSDPRYITPVMYLPGAGNPGYFESRVDESNIPSAKLTVKLSEYIEGLLKKRDPLSLCSFTKK